MSTQVTILIFPYRNEIMYFPYLLVIHSEVITEVSIVFIIWRSNADFFRSEQE